jgi:hypothetical protein
MAAEEQTLMNAFYNGTTFNGSVPTMQTIIDFYNRVADLSGIQQGSTDWDALMQKVGAANNYDIKQEYASLVNEFQNGNGANYEELSSFLKGRAQDSSDPQDSETYQNAVGDINKAYIGYQGEALGRGEITAADYRSLTTNILDQMDPADPKRYETLVNSYTYEWNAEKTKWDNRLTAGTVNASQYANWAKGFQNSLVSAGVSTDSTLYTAAVAAQAIAQNRGGGGAGSTVKTRIDKTLVEIDAIVDVALSLNPSTKPRSVSEIAASGKDSLKALTDDPALILLLGEALDQNPEGFPALSELGITDSTSLNIYFQGRLESGRADAALLVSSGGPDYTDSWYATSDAVGALSELSKFDFQSTKWLRDVAAAQGSFAKIEELNNEWKKYLSGENSKYGSLNADNLRQLPEFLTLAQNEYDAMTGASDGTLPTLSGTVNANIPLDFTTVQKNKDNIAAAKSGNGYQQWNDKIQEFEFVSGRPAGRTETGSYQFVEFSRVNGEIIAYVTSVNGTKVSDVDGNPIGWVYDQKNGSAPIVTNNKGELIDIPEAGLNGNQSSGFVLPDGATFKVSDNKLPLYSAVNLAVETKAPFTGDFRSEGGIDRNKTELIISPEDLRTASGLVAKVLPALGGNAMAGANIATDILADADKIQIGQINEGTSATTPKGRAEIARLSGNRDLEKAWLFVEANKDKLEIVNGGYRWKPGTAESTQQGTNPFGNAAVGAGLGAIAGVPGAILGGIGGFVQGALNYRQSPSDEINDINRQILNNDPTMKSQRESFYYSQPFVSPNAGASSGKIEDRFFRNFKAPAIPTSTGPRPSIPTVTSVRPSIPTVTRPGPSIPVAPVPFVAPMTQKYGPGSPFATTPIVQNQSTERRGGR